MANVKNQKNPNPRGQVNVAIGDLLKEVAEIAEQEDRSVNRQIAVIVREWLAARKAKATPAGAGAKSKIALVE